jgi:hypothetical protein
MPRTPHMLSTNALHEFSEEPVECVYLLDSLCLPKLTECIHLNVGKSLQFKFTLPQPSSTRCDDKWWCTILPPDWLQALCLTLIASMKTPLLTHLKACLHLRWSQNLSVLSAAAMTSMSMPSFWKTSPSWRCVPWHMSTLFQQNAVSYLGDGFVSLVPLPVQQELLQTDAAVPCLIPKCQARHGLPRSKPITLRLHLLH